MRIKNWTDFQHYKNRRPPWIKMHRQILDDPEFVFMDPTDFKVLCFCWMIASETDDGSLPASNVLAFRLRLASNVLAKSIKSLSDKGFIVDASNMLAECLQDASNTLAQSRGEIEGEIEGEEEGETLAQAQKEKTTRTRKSDAKDRSRPESLDEVKQYFAKKNFQANPVEFYEHYEAIGWVKESGVKIDKWFFIANAWDRKHRSMGKPDYREVVAKIKSAEDAAAKLAAEAEEEDAF